MSPQMAGTSPTVTDRCRSMATSSCVPPRGTPPTRYGSSTGPSICSPRRNKDASHATTSRSLESPSWAPDLGRPPTPRRRSRHSSLSRPRRGNGLRHDDGVRRPPGRHAVPQRDPGLRRPDHQPDRSRLLTQFGKFMGSTVSPDGRFLAATSADKSVVLQIFDLSTYKLIWTDGTASGVNQTLSDGTVGQEGPTYSPDGKFLWLPEQNGLTRFPVNPDGALGTPTRISLPAATGHSALVGQTKYSPDGSTLYAALNGQNSVVALDPNTGAVEQTWNVGIAPRELAFVGGKLYVSNAGGRQAQPGDTIMNSYGTQV